MRKPVSLFDFCPLKSSERLLKTAEPRRPIDKSRAASNTCACQFLFFLKDVPCSPSFRLEVPEYRTVSYDPAITVMMYIIIIMNIYLGCNLNLFPHAIHAFVALRSYMNVSITKKFAVWLTPRFSRKMVEIWYLLHSCSVIWNTV